MADANSDAARFASSPFTLFARTLLSAARRLSPRFWLARCFPLLAAPNNIPPGKHTPLPQASERARAVEYYVLGCLLVEVVLVTFVLLEPFSRTIRLVVGLLAGLRILDIVQTLAYVTVFDPLADRANASITSIARSLVLAWVNFLELVVCFGIIYAADYRALHGAGRPLTAFYFSVITQLTIGYGDVYPQGPILRSVVALHGLVSVLFIVLVFARFVTTLGTMRTLLERTAGDSRAERAD